MSEKKDFKTWYTSYPEGAELTVGDMLNDDGADAYAGWQACAALKNKRIAELEAELERERISMSPSLQKSFCIPLVAFENLVESGKDSGKFYPDFASWTKTNELAVKATNRWACYVSNGLDMNNPRDTEIWNFIVEQIKSLCPKDSDIAFSNTMSNLADSGLFFFDTEAELDAFYNIFSQPLTDSSAFYACTYNPKGQCMTENT